VNSLKCLNASAPWKCFSITPLKCLKHDTDSSPFDANCKISVTSTEKSRSRLSLKEMSINLGVLMDLHFLSRVSVSQFNERLCGAYHFEGVELFFDLLSKHWRQAVARCNFASPIIFATWPSVMELNTGTESGVTLDSTRWSIWDTL
jgi:hypothetical protein